MSIKLQDCQVCEGFRRGTESSDTDGMVAADNHRETILSEQARDGAVNLSGDLFRIITCKKRGQGMDSVPVYLGSGFNIIKLQRRRSFKNGSRPESDLGLVALGRSEEVMAA